MRTAVTDIETDGLNPTKIWVVVSKVRETGEKRVFRRPDLNPHEFVEYAATIDRWVFHNGIDFDVPHLHRLVPSLRLDTGSVLDTLVLSRLFNQGLAGGHSLEAWGQRFGYPKVAHEDWSQLSEEMVHRCSVDVDITDLLFTKIEPFLGQPQWQHAISIEHFMAVVCRQMHENGFAFNYDRALAVKAEIDNRLKELEDVIQKSFPPKAVPVGDIITPRLTKMGTLSRSNLKWAGDDLTPYTEDAPFQRFRYDPFNPGSPRQIVERLNEAGWKPYEKTKGHIQALKERPQNKEKLAQFEKYGWQVSEGNLATLPDTAPEGARRLAEWLTLADRSSTLTEWLECYNPATGRIHGTFRPIGAWTHRMSHSKPNTGNITRVILDKSGHPIMGGAGFYNADMRAMWCVPPGRAMVGVDAEGIQLRVLAHLMGDPAFIHGVTHGKKETGDDPHTLNMKALGPVCKDRDTAKTFIYAWLLGAGVAKVATILGCSQAEAKAAVEQFIEAYPGLKELKEVIIPRDAARGYFIGLDKRLVRCDNTHLMLAGYLQNGETVVMKTATRIWMDQLRQSKLLDRTILLNMVHDEWQTETDPSVAEYVAQVQKDSIRQAGEMLDLRCPLAGSSSIGTNWMETH